MPWEVEFLVGGFSSREEAEAMRLEHELRTRMQADEVFILLFTEGESNPLKLPIMVHSAIQTAPGGQIVHHIRYQGEVAELKPH